MKLLVALLCTTCLAPAASLQQVDRERVLSELHASRKQLLDAIQGLSQAQWTFKVAPERWSIAEVAEHIVASEAFLFTMVSKQITGSPSDDAKAAARKPGNGKMDEALLVQLRDRSQKARLQERSRPRAASRLPQKLQRHSGLRGIRPWSMYALRKMGCGSISSRRIQGRNLTGYRAF